MLSNIAFSTHLALDFAHAQTGNVCRETFFFGVCLRPCFGSGISGLWFYALQPTEDVAKFIFYSGFGPFAVSALCSPLENPVFLLRAGRAKKIATRVVQALRGPAGKRSPVLAWRVVVVVLLLPVGTGILQNVVGREAQVSQPLHYHTRIDVVLEDIDSDSTIYHTFEVAQPTTFDFVYSLETEADRTLRLPNLEGEPFVFNNQDSIAIYKGRESLLLAYFTGFALLRGRYGRFSGKQRLPHHVY